MDIQIHNGDVDLTPAEAGFREEALTRLDALLHDLIRKQQLQGASYLLSKDGRPFAYRSMGALRFGEDGGGLMPDSIRRVASVTKLFTVVCIMRLVEEGLVHLQQPVKDWIEEFKHPMYENITLHHLLTHTSGLRPDQGYFSEPYPVGWWEYEFAFGDDDEEKQWELTPEARGARKRSQWIKAMLAGVPVCKPGEGWHYASHGYALLGEIIRRQTGVPYEQYVRDEILEPLGMNRSFFQVPEALGDEVCLVNEWERKRLEDTSDRTYSPPRAGGGLYSTLGDLNRFGTMLLNMGTFDGQRLISRKSVEEMTRDQFQEGVYAYHWGEKNASFHMGLGVALSNPSEPFAPTTFGHEGAGRCGLLIDPAERLVASFFVPSVVDWAPLSIIGLKNIIWSGIR